MNYKILTFSDVHWGIMNAEFQYNEMQLIIDFIKMKKALDLIVICGDYYEDKLSMNSNASIYSTKFMMELYELCMKRKIKVRVVLGTLSHDNKQLEHFNHLDTGDEFRIIYNNFYEETLPGLKCLYCPDENISTDEYMITYLHNLLDNAPIDTMFFHGSFDVILPDIVLERPEYHSGNIVYRYDFFKDICRLMVGGHWHNGDQYEHMFYTRSVSRWEFNEEKDKGFVYINYNTTNHSYYLKRVPNPFTPLYITYDVDTSIMKSIDEYSALIDDIVVYMEKDQTARIRIKVNVSNDSSENESFINLLRDKFANNKRVKILIKNSVKEKKKKEIQKQIKEEENAFAFIGDKQKRESEIIQEFIRITKNKEVPLEFIQEYIDKFTKS